MMPITKDESIVTQVAAKVAADLTNKNLPAGERMAEYGEMFDGVQDLLFRKHGFGQGQPASAPCATVEAAFPNSTYVGDQYSQPFGDADRNRESTARPSGNVATATGTLRIAGTQHGPIPGWLYDATTKAGVTEVWDNRDQLSVNPKRPWFKDATNKGPDAVAFWPPRNN